MSDFKFLQDPISQKWISLSPRRAIRPDEAKEIPEICPFCPGTEKENPTVYEVLDAASLSWLVRVFANKYPFAPIHEVIVHSPDHHKSFGELPVTQVERIFQVYRSRYNMYKNQGQVYIFTNTGELAGESMPHPHSQIVAIPHTVSMDIPEYQISDSMFLDAGLFRIGCPDVSQWPDEVWFIPKQTGKTFGEIADDEITSLAQGMDTLVKMYSHRYGHEFPFNFYIRPGLDWYLRLIPRVKSLGGFEIGTGVYVNTQDPKETILFLKEHWENPDFEKIRMHHHADYHHHA
jgi:UDPglucose--hexose-1-phosphate uridylyltransferase